MTKSITKNVPCTKTIGTGQWILLSQLKLYHHSDSSGWKKWKFCTASTLEKPPVFNKYPNISKHIDSYWWLIKLNGNMNFFHGLVSPVALPCLAQIYISKFPAGMIPSCFFLKYGRWSYIYFDVHIMGENRCFHDTTK